MRIERLTITGFGPFRDTQVIDFAKFNNDLFLITGKTGAGKSSILDAICFAFYGDIPRYEKTDSALRCDYCEPDGPTEVQLEFSLADERYRIVRSPEYRRPAKRGGGMTTQNPRALLERFDGQKYTAVTAALRETNLEISGILRLSRAQFLQVILLAQGRFQDFLKASSEDRLSVLRSLFETTRFESLEKKLDDRRKELESGIVTAGAAATRHRADAVAILHANASASAGASASEDEDAPEQPDANWYAEQLVDLTALVEESRSAAKDAEGARAVANTELDRLREIERRQKERTDTQATLEGLALRADSVVADRVAIDADSRGAPVIPQLAVHSDAASAVVASAAELADASSNIALGTPPPADTAGARVLEQETDTTLGSLESALAQELVSPRLEAELEVAERQVLDATEAFAAIGSRVGELPGLIAAANDELQNLRAAAALEPASRAVVEQTEYALAAAERFVEARSRLLVQNEVMLAASTHDVEASRQHSELLHRQLVGYASVLATALVDGDACPVCGATAHPDPAEPDESTVTQDVVDSAKAAMDFRRAELDTATTLTSKIESELAADEASSGGRSVGELTDVTLDARSLLASAVDAVAGAESKRRALDALNMEFAATASESARLDGVVAAARAVRDPLAISVRDLAARLADARADFDSVASRAESLRTHRTALSQFRSASESLAHARLAEKKAAELVETLLAECGFASRQEVESTHLADADRLAISERIRQHQKDLDATRGILANLAGVPTEPVGLDVAVEAFAAASALRDSTRDAQIATDKGRADFAALVDAVASHEATSALLLQEYELVRQLASAVAGKTPNTKSMKLETYVLAAQLEDIVAAANQRLSVMTSGRYLLQHDDTAEYRNVRGGLGLEILDQYSGRVRPTHSLSGGETFLASLALALGLAEVVSSRSGAVKLDTLFIDEGFGSLDADTLELAMTTLDTLRAGGRTIGIISHVEAMKEQVHTQLRVEVGERGDSRVRV
jgi:exonuclease SbcC